MRKTEIFDEIRRKKNRMQYVEYGTEQKNIIIFLHGGGLAPWNFREEAKRLKDKYHVIIPVLDGHS